MTNDEDLIEDFDDAGSGSGAASPLAAPGSGPRRGAPASQGSRKGLLVALLVLVAAGLGGGYYYLTSMMEDVPPPHRQAAIPPPVPTATAATTSPAGPPPAAQTAAAMPPPVTASPVLSAPVTTDTAAVSASQPPATTTPPVAQVTVLPANLATANPALAVPSTAEATQVPLPEQKKDAAAANALPPPPAEEEAEAPKVIASQITTAVPETQKASSDLPAPSDGKAPPPADAEAVKTDTAAGSGAGTAKDGQKAEQALTAKPDGKAAAKPDAAEQAIVENAPMLDKISAPDDAAHKRAAEVDAQQAIVRPLPGKYLVVRKDTNADNVDARLSAARSALAEGRSQAALELFSDLKKKYPQDARVLMGRAIALQNLGQNEAALSAYEAVLAREPKNLEALTNMLGLLKGQNPALALAKLKELRNDYPANADITAQLGIACGASGDYASAVKYLDMADALAPGNAFVTYNKAVVYDRMGNSTQAAELYRRILNLAAEGSIDGQLPLEAIRARLAVLR